jgi:hypothetical protein
MLLRDIDLDLPYIKNNKYIDELISSGIAEDAAIKQDYQTNWKWRRWHFGNETRCIAEFYLRLLGKFETKETKKITINCVQRLRTNEVDTRAGFTEVEVEFSYDKYLNSNSLEKKKMILDKLFEGIGKIASVYGWDMSILEQVYLSIKENNYDNEYVWRKKASPSRKYIAEIVCQHNLDKYVIKMNIIDTKTSTLVKSELLKTETPHPILYISHLGNLKWESNNEAMLISRHSKKQWRVYVDTN